MSHITTSELSELSGLTVRQIQRIAASGGIPGSSRTQGGHWKIERTKQAIQWAKKTKKHRAEIFTPRLKTEGRGVRALKKAITRIEIDGVTDGPEIGKAIARLSSILAGGKNRGNRGGAWTELESAVDAIARWRSANLPVASRSERKHFEALLERISA